MNGRTSFVLFGIEAHVCVQQTCLDLLERGNDVHLIADGISSQQKYDRDIALDRMVNSGAYITTAQSLAFMLMQGVLFLLSFVSFYFTFLASKPLMCCNTCLDKGADHPQFKPVSKLTVEHMKTQNEFNSSDANKS